MADLMIPLLFVIVFIIIIDVLDSWFPLLLLSLILIPVAWTFAYVVGDYNLLFGADITAHTSKFAAYNYIISGVMMFMPVMGFLKIIWVREFLTTSKPQKGD